ncbi:MAG: hypothetical protein AB3N16_07880 [Flavobacteriaceae bacterium]
MITKEEIKNYKDIIGKNWSRKICDFLDEKGYRRDSNEKYTPQDVINFFNGRYSLQMHLNVLKAVEYYKNLNEQMQEEIQKMHKNLFKNKKPEAATSGDNP